MRLQARRAHLDMSLGRLCSGVMMATGVSGQLPLIWATTSETWIVSTSSNESETSLMRTTKPLTGGCSPSPEAATFAACSVLTMATSLAPARTSERATGAKPGVATGQIATSTRPPLTARIRRDRFVASETTTLTPVNG